MKKYLSYIVALTIILIGDVYKRQLIEQGIQPDDLIYYGLEYKYLTLYVIGKLTYEEMFTHCLLYTSRCV